MRVLLADDEPIALERLAGLLRAHTDVEIVGMASDGVAAARLIETLRPDLVFLDIEMPRQSGIDVARALKQAIGSDMDVIFVTAFHAFAAEAFELDAVDYLLKPVAPERLQASIRRAERRALAAAPRDPTASPASDDYASELWVRHRGGTVRINVDDIEWIEAAGDYVLIHTAERSHMQRVTMELLQRQLDPAIVVRVSRSAFVREKAVGRVERVRQGGIDLVLRDDVRVAVGHTYLRAVVRRFGLKPAAGTKPA